VYPVPEHRHDVLRSQVIGAAVDPGPTGTPTRSSAGWSPPSHASWVGTPVTFHLPVSGRDPSFGPSQLDVKADANPPVGQRAYFTPKTRAASRSAATAVAASWHCASSTTATWVSVRVQPPGHSVVQSRTSDGVLARACRRTRFVYDPTVIPALGRTLPKIRRDHRGRGLLLPPRLSDPVTPRRRGDWMSIADNHQDLAEPAGKRPRGRPGPGGVMRPWWLRPGSTSAWVGATRSDTFSVHLRHFLSSA